MHATSLACSTTAIDWGEYKALRRQRDDMRKILGKVDTSLPNTLLPFLFVQLQQILLQSLESVVMDVDHFIDFAPPLRERS